MRTSVKLGLTALAAALLLSAALSTASARNLSVSNRNIRVTWSSLEYRSPVATIRCRVTIEGSFHSATIPKVERTLVGYITRAVVATENCTNAKVTAEGLPWHITYESFTGTLPRIETVRLLLRNILLNWSRILGTAAECRWGTATDNVTFAATVNAAGEVTTLVPVAGRNTLHLLERRNETLLVRCPAEQTWESSAADGSVTLLGTTTRIRVTLI
jgi:hypothetical protein